LFELKLPERAIRRLTYRKMLARSVDVTEAPLQRIGIEESTAARSLKGGRRHALR